MSEREYIVSLNRGVDYNEFWDQIENLSEDDGFVLTRRVDIVNDRPGSLRSCHYSLTDKEAEFLRNDPRVYGVDVYTDTNNLLGGNNRILYNTFNSLVQFSIQNAI